jgi:hypothetical protein
VWLFVPGTSSPSAQASEASNSASCSPCTIGERLAEASATWRGKPRLPQAWSRAWKQGGFIRLLSGPTCSPSTLDRGVAVFISSLREIPAKRTASPESALDPQESASLPPKSAASPRSAGLILSSARTCQGTRTDSSPPSLRHWKGWATALRQEYSARPKPVTPCGASDCSSWPSATVLDSTNTRNSTANRSNPNSTHSVGDTLCDAVTKWAAPRVLQGGPNSNREARGAGGPDLQEQATQWMAPNVPNGGRSASHAEQIGNTLYHGDKKVQLGLEHQAKDWSAPKASDGEKGGPNQRGSKGDVPLPGQAANWPCPMTADDGRKVTGTAHQAMLCNVAASFHPPSSLDQRIAGGSTSSTASPNSNQPSVRRKLNPIFVEALMRWPTGLSGFERQATAWTRWWLLMPSFLSTLCSPAASGPEQIPLFGEAA